MDTAPKTVAEYIDSIRARLVCDQCGRYVGSLARNAYLPAPYPVRVDKLGADDEADALIGFEWHMVGLVAEGKFVVRHPQRDGRCVSIREWAAEDDELEEFEDSGADEHE